MSRREELAAGERSVEAGAPPGQPAGYAIYPITLQGANPAPFLVPARETSYRCHRIDRKASSERKAEGKTW